MTEYLMGGLLAQSGLRSMFQLKHGLFFSGRPKGKQIQVGGCWLYFSHFLVKRRITHHLVTVNFGGRLVLRLLMSCICF